MTLPLWCELHWLPHATSSGIRCTFKQEIHVHDDYLIFPHHMPFMQMLSNQYIFPTKFFKHIFNTATVRLFQKFHCYYHGDCRLLAYGMRIFHLEHCYCFLTVCTEDLDPVTLSIATEHIYTTFFWTSTSHILCQQSEETLFGHFVIALNAAFTQQLSLADEGYESSSDTIDLPTPLWKTCIHHISSLEHGSFNPVNTTPCSTVTITPCSTPQTPTRPVHQCLSFSSDTDHTPDSTSACSDSSDEEEEDFQMVPLDDKHWTSEEVPERTFCIHEHGLPHNLCQYPCPYGSNDTVSYMDSLDLSDILDYEDYMVTSSDEELLGMEEVPYWHWTLVCLNTYLKFQF